MPNWVTNRIKTNKSIDKVIEKIVVDGEVDFNTIVPMPKELNIQEGSNTKIAVEYATNKKLGRAISQELQDVANDFNSNLDGDGENFEIVYGERAILKDLGINNFEDLGNLYISNKEKYGDMTWYYWSVNNWGTKWNSKGTYLDNDSITFDTAWNMPAMFIEELSKEFSDIEFTIDYADEDLGSNCGHLIVKNGEIIEFYEGDLDFALDVWGYDKEEYYAEMEEEEE